jgi:hypothetical protein
MASLLHLPCTLDWNFELPARCPSFKPHLLKLCPAMFMGTKKSISSCPNSSAIFFAPTSESLMTSPTLPFFS